MLGLSSFAKTAAGASSDRPTNDFRTGFIFSIQIGFVSGITFCGKVKKKARNRKTGRSNRNNSRNESTNLSSESERTTPPNRRRTVPHAAGRRYTRRAAPSNEGPQSGNLPARTTPPRQALTATASISTRAPIGRRATS